jgi:uncharacterized protein YuzE
MTHFQWIGSILAVDFNDVGFAIEFVDAVVDLGELGELIGIEILGLIAKHPTLKVEFTSRPGDGNNVEGSFDTSADALYIRFKAGRSLDQEVRPAVVIIGSDGALLKVVVRMEDDETSIV